MRDGNFGLADQVANYCLVDVCAVRFKQVHKVFQLPNQGVSRQGKDEMLDLIMWVG